LKNINDRPTLVCICLIQGKKSSALYPRLSEGSNVGLRVHPVQTSVFIFDKEIGKFFEFFFLFSRVNWTYIFLFCGKLYPLFYISQNWKEETLVHTTKCWVVRVYFSLVWVIVWRQVKGGKYKYHACSHFALHTILWAIFVGWNFAPWRQKKRGWEWYKGFFWKNRGPCRCM